MARFTGIPALPQSGVDEWQMRLLDALKQNVELLTGTRAETDSASRALLRSTVTVGTLTSYQYRGLTARGAGFTISGVRVPSYTDYESLLRDVAHIGQDVAALRDLVNNLISQLKA